MASVKPEDCSQTLELNAFIKDEEEEEKIGKSVFHGMRPVTSTVRTNPACLSPTTLSPNLQSLGPDCDSGAQFALQDPEMASVKLEDCSQTLELNVNIKDEEEEEKIGKYVSHGRLELSLMPRPVTSIVRTNPACLSHSTLNPNLQSLGPDCDSGAQFALQDSEMASVKLEDCSQTLELNVIIKDEEEEEKIGKSVNDGHSLVNEVSLGNQISKGPSCSSYRFHWMSTVFRNWLRLFLCVMKKYGHLDGGSLKVSCLLEAHDQKASYSWF
ncbi:uncharacterized protein LOC129860147 isoform X3 [Salvelinus fontinalis]|uniref:uncharacterized protein LOC129860147 isoform X3 n=1 Tax=Salvelinus fontinalis TaxID=8038 RepID=UPI002485A759|nr:uncharacterized protein LOC129860147 isoform X3 [Salvelinus fontinalis]